MKKGVEKSDTICFEPDQDACNELSCVDNGASMTDNNNNQDTWKQLEFIV